MQGQETQILTSGGPGPEGEVAEGGEKQRAKDGDYRGRWARRT